MGNVGNLIAQPAALTVLFAEKLLTGVSAAQFARFARPGGVEVRSNHGAWVFGHLSLYPQRVFSLLGRDASTHKPPAHYEELFKNGAECRDDATGTIYPPMSELTSFFFSSYKAAIAAVVEARDEAFLAPNPAEGRMKELFPLAGGAIGFYLSGHAQQHLGQMSAWRRALGLPPA